MIWRGWNDDNTATAIRLWSEGVSAGDIGKQIGTSRNSVIGKIHRMNLQGGGRASASAPRASNVLWTDEETAELRRLAAEGLTAPQIAARMGIERGRVHNRAKTIGLNITHEIIERVKAPPVKTTVYEDSSPRPAHGITVVEMPVFGRCRFPIWGTGPDMLMCGEATVPDVATYCPSCAARAFNPVTKTQKSSMDRGAIWAAKRGTR